MLTFQIIMFVDSYFSKVLLNVTFLCFAMIPVLFFFMILHSIFSFCMFYSFSYLFTLDTLVIFFWKPTYYFRFKYFSFYSFYIFIYIDMYIQLFVKKKCYRNFSLKYNTCEHQIFLLCFKILFLDISWRKFDIL